MQDFNYHTHTYRCGHASGDDEEYILAAIKAGYKTLGFADHAPYKDYPLPSSHMDISMFDEYVDSISILKEKYKDQIDIKIGLESEYYKANHDERVMLHDRLDYLILGQHFLDPEASVSFFKNNSEEEILEYGKLVCEALDTGLFMYLAHPDVFMSKQENFTKACVDVARMIASKCVDLDIPVELNVHNVRKGKHLISNKEEYFYPNKSFWTIMSEYPIKVLLGIDAHKPEDLLDFDAIEKSLNEVSDLNLNFITKPLI